MTPKKAKQVWPDDEPGLPPLDAVVPALESFRDIGDADPLDIEVRISTFLGALGAGDPAPVDDDEPDHEELLNGLVEVCLHHLDADPPRVVVDFLWVLDAFGVPWIHWPLRQRLESSALPSSPAWAAAVGQAEVVSTHVVDHETGDGYDVAIIGRHPSATVDHVVAVYIDRNLGGVARDLLVHPDAAEFLRLSASEPGMTVTEIDPAQAAATIDEAIDVTFAAGEYAPVAEEFGSLFTVVEHYVGKLPPGGAPLPEPEPASSEEQLAVVERFLGSLHGLAHGRDREVLVAAVGFVVDELGGDPLRWTPVVCEIVLAGWLPRAGFDDEVVDRFPALLRAFVPWAHAEKGWGDRYVEEAKAVIAAVESGELAGPSTGGGQVQILEEAIAAGVDLDDEEALDAFLDEYLGDDGP